MSKKNDERVKIELDNITRHLLSLWMTILIPRSRTHRCRPEGSMYRSAIFGHCGTIRVMRTKREVEDFLSVALLLPNANAGGLPCQNAWEAYVCELECLLCRGARLQVPRAEPWSDADLYPKSRTCGNSTRFIRARTETILDKVYTSHDIPATRYKHLSGSYTI